MSGFSIDWLDLREDADRRARDPQLLDQALAWLQSDPASTSLVVDLGAGTGSTLRALTGRATSLSAALSWRLVDHDTDLLAEARRRHGDSQRLETCRADLADVTALPLAKARLVTASALFDLVSEEFLQSLSAVMKSLCQQQPAGIYAALNYDGTTLWTPAHPLDEAVLRAFNRDQQRDKGFGLALGPDAGQVMEQEFHKAGFRVLTARSPWRLDGTDSRLVSALIEGIGHAVSGDPGLQQADLNDWLRFRQAQVTTGTCEVGHTDLLALPDTA